MLRTLLAVACCLSCRSTPSTETREVLPVGGAEPSSAPAAAAVAGQAEDRGALAKARPIEAGTPAPDVELVLADGKKQRLSDYQGQNVILYFYPADDTPGCTIEAQGFRDHHHQLQSARTIVLGVSTQDAESHRAFIDKYQLPFALVIDSEGTVAKAFDVPVRNGVAARHSFLIDHGGRIARVWRDVTPSGHAEQVIAAIQELRH